MSRNMTKRVSVNRKTRPMIDGNTAVFLTEVAGHRLWYVRLLCNELRIQGRTVDVFLPSSAEMDDGVSIHLAPILDDSVSLSYFKPNAAVERLSSLLDVYSEVLLPDGDKLLAGVALHMSRQRIRHLWNLHRRTPTVRLLLMRFMAGSGLRGRSAYSVKLALTWVAKKHLPSLRVYALAMNTIDLDDASKMVRWVSDVVAFDPSPAMDRDSARRQLGLALNDTLVSIVGAITSRKCYREATEGLQHSGPNVRLLVAGKLDESARLFFENQSSERITVKDNYIEDRELDQYILASDAVLNLLTNTGSSGIALKALAAGTPLIAHGNPDVDSHVRKQFAGIVIDDLSPECVGAGIKAALNLGRRNMSVVSDGGTFARALLVDS
jgi:glycosyltransferase involved in cell wall biosynthesis